MILATLKFIENVRRYYTGLLSSTCILCQSATQNFTKVCQHCKNELPYLSRFSLDNVKVSSEDVISFDESHMKILGKNYRRFSVFSYEPPIERLINQLKFKNGFRTAYILGLLMAEKMKAVYSQKAYPECIIPMALHRDYIKKVGFNPITELCKPIAKLLNIPVDYNACYRTRNTLYCSDIPFSEKMEDLKDAFLANKHLESKYVCIIDDIFTTGATTFSLAKSLFAVGVKRVDVWCCAKAS